jgi:hypothetical protein
MFRMIAVPILLTICFGGQFGCNADTQVLGRDRQPMDPGRARARSFLVEGKRVEVWVAASPPAVAHGPKGFVLFFTGQGDRVERYVVDLADSWDRWPVEIWGMNYPGSGGSQGPAEIARVTPMSLDIYDEVKHIAGDRPIFVQGVSLGTTAALSVAARRPVDGVILFNPPPLRQLIVGEYSWWNFGLIARYIANEVPTDLDSVANASRCIAPAVIFSAGNDQTVPPKYQRMVIDAYAGPKHVVEMPGRDHDDGLSDQARRQLDVGKDWLWDLAKRRHQ